MTKAQLSLSVIHNNRLSDAYSHLVLQADSEDSEIVDLFRSITPGQFVEVRVDGSKNTFLRRPISVNYVDEKRLQLHLLIRRAGEGTSALCDLRIGQLLNVIMPLGIGFTVTNDIKHPLLIGGGVGVAPLLYLGKKLREIGVTPTFLLAAKTSDDILMHDCFSKFGKVLLSTDDGSAGHKGLVTENPALESDQWDMFYCCGPMPMMRGIAKIASRMRIECEVSLENTMACGLGACLCCVEDTIDGNVCVCKDGPVFNISKLKW